MSRKTKAKSSLLAPVIGVYEPTEADAERIFAKVEATLDAEAAGARAPVAAAGRRTLLVASVSVVAIALVGAVALRVTSAGPNPPPASAQALESPPAPVVPMNEKSEANDQAIPLVAIDRLPNSAVSAASAPTPGIKKPPSTSSATHSEPARVPENDTLEKEARVLADARRASQDGAGERALSLLDEHARTFPNGWLANERDAERVLVLCRLGRRAEASRVAAVFLEGRPRGPLTRRVEMSCAGSADSKALE